MYSQIRKFMSQIQYISNLSMTRDNPDAHMKCRHVFIRRRRRRAGPVLKGLLNVSLRLLFPSSESVGPTKRMGKKKKGGTETRPPSLGWMAFKAFSLRWAAHAHGSASRWFASDSATAAAASSQLASIRRIL